MPRGTMSISLIYPPEMFQKTREYKDIYRYLTKKVEKPRSISGIVEDQLSELPAAMSLAERPVGSANGKPNQALHPSLKD